LKLLFDSLRSVSFKRRVYRSRVNVIKVAPIMRITGAFVGVFVSLISRLAPLHWLLLYCYRRVTIAFGYHEADALGLLADTSEKTGLAKACCECFEKLSRRELQNISEDAPSSPTCLVSEKLVRLCFLQPKLAKEELFPC